MYENRTYCVFSVSELDKIDFDQVHETSVDTVRRSVDGTLTFVKWDGEAPVCLEELEVATYYTHDEMLNLLSTPEWTAPLNIETP